MFYVFLLLLVASLFAALSEYGPSRQSTMTPTRYAFPLNTAYFILLLILIWFSGTRTVGNDTAVYIHNFLYRVPSNFDELEGMNFSLGSNPGFVIYQTLIKSVFGSNFTIFLCCSASIVTISFLRFFRRYSQDFLMSIFLFIASTAFAFTMAAQKQALATAIGIWILPLAYRKKWISAAFLLALAMTIHPYVFMFALIPIVMGPVWKSRSILILLACITFVAFLQTFITITINALSTIGDRYEVDNFAAEGIGVNVLRLAVFAVVPVLSYIYRREINKSGDTIFQTFCNLSLISFGFMFIAFFTDPNSFGRLAEYFSIFTILALSGLLKNYLPINVKGTVRFACYICFMLYYYTFYTKYGTSLFIDYYEHISLF